MSRKHLPLPKPLSLTTEVAEYSRQRAVTKGRKAIEAARALGPKPKVAPPSKKHPTDDLW